MNPNNTKTIVFTGGGTAGHVTPNLALIDKFKKIGWNIEYIGSNTGIEKKIIEQHGIHFHGIASGKLRRYFSWKNFIDPIKITWGILQSIKLLRQLKPKIVFSKGGFVSVPVVIAARFCRIPVIAHESDFSPGLANKLTFPFVKTLCLSFADSQKYFSNKDKIIVTGSPIRASLLTGDKEEGLQSSGLSNNKPVILAIGGSAGAEVINKSLRDALGELLNDFQVLHICGPGKVDRGINKQAGYVQYDYVDKMLPHYFALADLVISRAGANVLNEILALEKPHILIPLSKKASRGDQIENAAYTEKQGLSRVIPEENLTSSLLAEQVRLLYNQRDQYKTKIKHYNAASGTDAVFDVIIGAAS